MINVPLLVLVVFLQAALLAAAVHLWSMRSHKEPAKLSSSPRFLIVGLCTTVMWASSFIGAVHRTTVASVISQRYFASSAAPALEDGAADGKQQGGPADFSEQPEETEAARPSPMATLHLCLEQHTGAIAKGSAISSFLRNVRSAHLVLERRGGSRGAMLAAQLFKAFPCLLPAIYLRNHAYVIIGQRKEPMAFLQSAKVAFRLFARNPEGKVLLGFSSDDFLLCASYTSGCLAVLSTLERMAGETLHSITAVVAFLLTVTIFNHLEALVRDTYNAISVCYLQEVERCRPDAPVRCLSKLQDAVCACWDKLPQEDQEEKTYSTERELMHGGDGV
uniref:Choline transporter-like protein n=1 Tax=Guillardia theta TaxID=55529 RepID=A0A7S4PHB4_GUITH